MHIKTTRLNIRPVIAADLNNVHHLHSLPETDRYNTMGIPESIEVTQSYLAQWILSHEQVPQEKYVFVAENFEQEFIGMIGVNIGKPRYRIAEIWFKLLPNQWNKGYATEMALGILHFCFNDLNLHRIEAGCAVENIASKTVIEKIGMIQEGMSRKILPIRGEWFDGYRFAILESDYFVS
jgi:[ribosomal protein S5]-alanine N-acetyltransferase